MAASLSVYSAFLFDFDGTLADSYGAIAASVNHVRSLHGASPLAVDEVKRHVGRGPQYLLEHTVPGCRLPEDVNSYRAHHPSVMIGLTHLLPGATDLLNLLRKRGKLIGLCSNKPRLFSRELLENLRVADHFDVILGPEDVARPKPAPDMLLQALKTLELRADSVLYIGDMTVDIQTAREAGIAVWVVPTGSDERSVLEAACPDRILTDLCELVVELQAS